MKFERPFLIPNGPQRFPTAPEVVIGGVKSVVEDEKKEGPQNFPTYTYSFKITNIGSHAKEIVSIESFSCENGIIELPTAGFVAIIPGDMKKLGKEWLDMFPEELKTMFEEKDIEFMYIPKIVYNDQKTEGSVTLEPEISFGARSIGLNTKFAKIHPSIIDVIGRTFAHEAAINSNFSKLTSSVEIRLQTPKRWRESGRSAAHFDQNNESMYVFSSILPTEQFIGQIPEAHIKRGFLGSGVLVDSSFPSENDTSRGSLLPGTLYRVNSDWLHAIPESISDPKFLKDLPGGIGEETPRVFVRIFFEKPETY